MAADIIHLSSIVRSPLLGSDGERIGRVEDVIVRPGEQAHPPASGIVARIGRRELFVPISMVASVRPGRVQLQGETLNLARFERRQGELLLAKDLSARHLINIVGARLIRANEIELALVDGRLEVVGVDPSSRPVLRRLLPRSLAQRIPAKAIVDWESIQPFVSHVPTARLRIPYRKLARLHPAQIADLVEAASHEEGEEIINAVGQDLELEADVFEELDTEHQLEFLSDPVRQGRGPAAGDDGTGRRRRPDRGSRPGPAPSGAGGAARTDTGEGPCAPQLQPGDRRRPDEPGVPRPARRHARLGGARGDPAQPGRTGSARRPSTRPTTTAA